MVDSYKIYIRKRNSNKVGEKVWEKNVVDWKDIYNYFITYWIAIIHTRMLYYTHFLYTILYILYVYYKILKRKTRVRNKRKKQKIKIKKRNKKEK